MNNEVMIEYIGIEGKTKQALEKQMPKKPMRVEYPWAICSVCGGSFSLKNIEEHIMHHEVTYCEHCGQAIDWRGKCKD